MESQGERLAQRRRIAGTYLRALAGLSGVRLPLDVPGHAWHLFVVHVPAEIRDAVIDNLIRAGVRPSRHFRPVHEFTYWRSTGLQRWPLPQSEAWGRTSLSLPLYPSMTDAEIEYVVDRFADSVRRCAAA
jgi:dTDP-4-amino-4,6-dideoxygalactose transaminase